MEKAKEFLTFAPFGALALAVVYLQGYWGLFDVFPLPYLEFRELLSYSAIPLFTIVIGGLSGAGLAWLDVSSPRSRGEYRKSSNRTDLIILAMLSVGAIAIYFGNALKWFMVPMGMWLLLWTRLRQTKAISSLAQARPALVSTLSMSLIFLVGTWSLGRTNAAIAADKPEPSTVFFLEASEESGWWLGKLGEFYFYLDSKRHVILLRDTEVKRVLFKRDIPRSGSND